MKSYFVYIASNRSDTLYVGVTNDLQRRMNEHKSGEKGFTSKYKIDRLLYYEETSDVNSAIAREKQLKNWHHDWKKNLIREFNPQFLDLSEEDQTLKQVQGYRLARGEVLEATTGSSGRA